MGTRKISIAAGLMLALAAPAFGDTPIGPGVTGSGGTGPNRSDPSTGAGPGTELRQGEREGNASAAAKARSGVSTDGKAGSSATGATSGAGAAAGAGAGSNVKGGGAPGGTQY